MEKDNPYREKSYQFALKIIDLSKILIHQKSEHVLSKQVLKNGTAIGACVEEALGSQTRTEYYQKMTLAYKEARVTLYWLRLLADSFTISTEMFLPLQEEAEELIELLHGYVRANKPKVHEVSVKS